MSRVAGSFCGRFVVLGLLLAASAGCPYGLVVEDPDPVRLPPTDLAIDDPRDGASLSLTWQRPPQGGLDAMRLVRRAGAPPSSADDANAEAIYDGLDEQFVDDGQGTPLVDGTEYHYAVFAIYGGDASEPARASEVLSTFLPPTDLTARANVDGTIALAWQYPAVRGDVVGVALTRDGTEVFRGDATTFVDDGAPVGTAVSFAVASVDADGVVSPAIQTVATAFVDTSHLLSAVAVDSRVEAAAPSASDAGAAVVAVSTDDATEVHAAFGVTLPADGVCDALLALIDVDDTGAGTLRAHAVHAADSTDSCDTTVFDLLPLADGAVIVALTFHDHVVLRGADDSEADLRVSASGCDTSIFCTDAAVVRIDADGHVAWSRIIGSAQRVEEGDPRLVAQGATEGLVTVTIDENAASVVDVDGVSVDVPADEHTLFVRFAFADGALEAPVLATGGSVFSAPILAHAASTTFVSVDGRLAIPGVVDTGTDFQRAVIAFDDDLGAARWAGSLDAVYVNDALVRDDELWLVGGSAFGAGSWTQNSRPAQPIDERSEPTGLVLRIAVDTGVLAGVEPLGVPLAADGAVELLRTAARADGALDVIALAHGNVGFGPPEALRIFDLGGQVLDSRFVVLRVAPDDALAVALARPITSDDTADVVGLVPQSDATTVFGRYAFGPLTVLDGDDQLVLPEPTSLYDGFRVSIAAQ